MKLTTVEGFPLGQNSGCTNEQKLLLSCRQPPRLGSHRCPVYTWCRMAGAPPGHKRDGLGKQRDLQVNPEVWVVSPPPCLVRTIHKFLFHS